MFIEALVIAIIIGYLLKGKLTNIDTSKIKALYLVYTAFFIEFIVIMLIRNSIINNGIVTYVLDLIMYALLFIFTYFNKKNPWITIMGTGFLLNAIPIFLNGGAMPVGLQAIDAAGLTHNITKEGLYTLIDNNTKLWFLGDIIPLTILRHFAISIGDIIAAVGLMLFVIMGMKKEIKSV